MKNILVSAMAIACLSFTALSQTNTSPFGIKFSGFVRSDMFMDTRENVVLREGMFNIYPEMPNYDSQGRDMNEKMSFSFFSINTRLTGKISGPDALGARTSGLIEGEFFGTSDADINGFRMRHAYMDLLWKSTELRVGQTWHPMFIPECFPQTISFNTGGPFNVFNRSPQVRLTRHFGRLDVQAAVLTERDFQSRGPDPADPSKVITSTQFVRNSGLPEFQVIAKLKLDSSGKSMIGGGLGTKSVKPELYTVGTVPVKSKSDQVLRSFSGFAFLKMSCKSFEMRLSGIYCQNACDLTMLGGYAVKEVLIASSGKKTFTPISTFSAWGDFQYLGPSWKAGIFLGYSSNLGAADGKTAGIYYSRGSNIAYIYRISPRYTYTSGKLELNVELEYSVAAYGKADSRGLVKDTKEVNNIRPLLTTVYNF